MSVAVAPYFTRRTYGDASPLYRKRHESMKGVFANLALPCAFAVKKRMNRKDRNVPIYAVFGVRGNSTTNAEPLPSPSLNAEMRPSCSSIIL